jgi:uncharacterized protein (DUF952 family)
MASTTPTTDASPAATAWRLVYAAEWEGIQATGTYPGSPLDIADGYLHMSPASQVRESAVRYFGGKSDVVLLKVGACVRGGWECASAE